MRKGGDKKESVVKTGLKTSEEFVDMLKSLKTALVNRLLVKVALGQIHKIHYCKCALLLVRLRPRRRQVSAWLVSMHAD